MKKYIIPAAVVVLFGVYLLLTRQQSTYVASNPAVPTVASGSATGTPAATPAGSNPPGGATSSAAAGAYKDGTYQGSVADAYFGNLQVAAVISGGKLADVQILESPQDSGHSAQVSRTSLPVLTQEAIQSQSANVNIVSGATQTSEAYQQSLQVALTAAKS
jgi:uncharacterized protein with FMN-binding domain